MDAIRRGLLRVADDVSLAFQNAGKSFGYLDDGRDLVAMSGDDASPVVTFPDHSDEGWPEVRVGLPVGSVFRSAMNGPLSRVATWRVARTESEVLKELSASPDVPPLEPTAGGGVVATFGANAILKVKSVNVESTWLSVTQLREPEAIGVVLRNRAARHRRGRDPGRQS